MVKSKHLEACDDIINEIEREISNCIVNLSIGNLPWLMNLVLRYKKVKTISRTSVNSYAIAFICFALSEYSKNRSYSHRIRQFCEVLIKKLFYFQKSGKLFASNLKTFQIAQEMINVTMASFFGEDEAWKENHQIMVLLQLLKVFQGVKFRTVVMALLKILNGVKKKSIFSYFTNDKIPVLPDLKLKKPTLVLDLDETLGHFNGSVFLKRPGSSEFLLAVGEKFEIVLFTAASEIYANSVFNRIDDKRTINLRLYRQHLITKDGQLCKDLRILGRDLDKVIIIDNESSYFRNQPDNGIEIKTWKGDLDDKELFKIADFLCGLTITESFSAKETVSDYMKRK